MSKENYIRNDGENNIMNAKMNQNTNFLKIVACISMLIDHIGDVFFPQYPIFRWIGRIAFPIFCYCLSIGVQYTHDIKKYFLRLGLFAILSQPFYVLAFHPNDFWGNIADLNIFFTLLICLLATWGLKERKWWLLILCIGVFGFGSFDYSADGIVLTLIFYLCRNKPWLGASLCVLNYLPVLFTTSPDNPLAPIIVGHAVGFEIFSVFALPLIYFKTSHNWRVSKWIFYIFYPFHLLGIFIIRLLLHI